MRAQKDSNFRVVEKKVSIEKSIFIIESEYNINKNHYILDVWWGTNVTSGWSMLDDMFFLVEFSFQAIPKTYESLGDAKSAIKEFKRKCKEEDEVLQTPLKYHEISSDI